MKTKEVICNGIRDQIKKTNLIASGQADLRVVNLLDGQLRLLQQRP
jgi:hypothetical protein